jgi:hypothetical protein
MLKGEDICEPGDIECKAQKVNLFAFRSRRTSAKKTKSSKKSKKAKKSAKRKSVNGKRKK